MTDPQKFDKATQLADELPPEQAARLAGVILQAAGINRGTVQVFLEELTDGDEFTAQVESLAKETGE